MSVATNPDLSLGFVRPGVYVAVDLAAPGGSVQDISKRVLVLAYMTSDGIAPPNKPFLCVSDDQAIQQCGRRSDARRGFARAVTQAGAGSCDIWICPLLEPSGGTAATYLMTFLGTATSFGNVDITVDGLPMLSVAYSTGDTGTSIATNVAAAITAIVDAPCTASATSTTVTLVYPHKGAVGEDLPLRAQTTVGSGITISAGMLTLSGTATGAGSATVTIGAITVSTAISNSDPAATIATNIAASINAGDYGVTATVSGAVVTLLYAVGRDVRRISAAIITTTGITATLAVGTPGVGAPTVTAALTALSATAGFAHWATPFTGTQASADTSTMGTLVQFVQQQANGVIMQDQRLHFGTAWPEATQGALVSGTSPAMTSTPYPAGMWCPDAGIQGFELACQVAALRAANDYPAQNWDGTPLQGSVQWPLILPAQSSRPDSPTINAAMRSYYLTPLRVDEGSNQLVIEKATTTSNSNYLPLRDFATIDQVAYWRFSLRQRLAARFSQVNSKAASPPRTPKTISPDAVADEAYLLAIEWDNNDLYDGATTFKTGFQSQRNAQNPSRLDLVFPMSPVVNVHQIGALGALVSPPQS